MSSYFKTKPNTHTQRNNNLKQEKVGCLQSLVQFLLRKPSFHTLSGQANPLVILAQILLFLPWAHVTLSVTCSLSLIFTHHIVFSMIIYVSPQRRSNSFSVYLQRFPGLEAAAFNLCFIICILHFLEEVI